MEDWMVAGATRKPLPPHKKPDRPRLLHIPRGPFIQPRVIRLRRRAIQPEVAIPRKQPLHPRPHRGLKHLYKLHRQTVRLKFVKLASIRRRKKGMLSKTHLKTKECVVRFALGPASPSACVRRSLP